MEKRGAMELSIGTIVIIVLAMSMLILGIIVVKSIFTGAKGVSDMTMDQLRSEVGKLFGEYKRVVIYPTNLHVYIKPGETDGFGIGIKNLLKTTKKADFSYEVLVSDPDIKSKCGYDAEEVKRWIVTGRAEKSGKGGKKSY